MNEQNNLYPAQYKVKNNCLYIEKTNKQGPYLQKLCNFIPYLTEEITVDDGVREMKKLKLEGVHEDGRKLKEIEISGNELASFNWLLEYWGIDCNLEIGCNVKESIRYAIQSTANRANRKTIYAVTGWKKIDGKWIYLMPGNNDFAVELSEKLKRYETANEFQTSDVALVRYMLDFEIVPKKIMYPLLAFTFLTPLNEFLHRANCEPKFVLALVGRTGARKSTLAGLFLSFFGKFNASDLPLSFQDTQNSILHHAFELKDVLTCIDDFHPSIKQDERTLNSTAQAIMRAYGDRVGRGRLKADSSPMNARPPQGNAIITAEFPPDIGESGTARYFTVELKEKDVNLESLSMFQEKAYSGEMMRCMRAYIEFISEIVNGNEKEFVDRLRDAFLKYRNEFSENKIKCHGRVPEMVAWLRIGMKVMLKFLKKYGMADENTEENVNEEFKEILTEIARNQSENIDSDKPSYKFIRKLISLIESGSYILLDRMKPCEMIPKNCIGYEDEEFYYLNKESAHKAVKSLCEEQGESFTVSEKGLMKALAEEKLISTDGNQNTKSVRCGGKSKRVVCLYKDKANEIYNSAL